MCRSSCRRTWSATSLGSSRRLGTSAATPASRRRRPSRPEDRAKGPRLRIEDEMEVSATAKYLPVSARKIRLVLDQLPGKRIDEAMVMLRYLPTPHARIVAKVLKSAAANAENNFAMDPEDLRV